MWDSMPCIQKEQELKEQAMAVAIHSRVSNPSTIVVRFFKESVQALLVTENRSGAQLHGHGTEIVVGRGV